MDVPEQDNPWLKMAGMWDKDDPLVQEWKEIMRENRLKDENNPFLWENRDESPSI